jgi:putative hydrolase of the HAD superfamily
MDNHKIKAIIFDLGNVLLDFDHRIAAERISKFSDKASDEIFNLFFDSHLTGLFEEGKVSPQQFFSQVKEMLHLKIDYDEFVPIWNEIFFFTEKNLGVYNLAHELKNCHRLALLSNINILHFEYVKKTFPVFGAFHTLITSFEMGVRKPESQIYKKTLQVLDASPQETFYTDDRPELIKGARDLGIRGFVFKGLKQLKNDLLDSGIKIN